MRLPVALTVLAMAMFGLTQSEAPDNVVGASLSAPSTDQTRSNTFTSALDGAGSSFIDMTSFIASQSGMTAEVYEFRGHDCVILVRITGFTPKGDVNRVIESADGSYNSGTKGGPADVYGSVTLPLGCRSYAQGTYIITMTDETSGNWVMFRLESFI